MEKRGEVANLDEVDQTIRKSLFNPANVMVVYTSDFCVFFEGFVVFSDLGFC